MAIIAQKRLFSWEDVQPGGCGVGLTGWQKETEQRATNGEGLPLGGGESERSSIYCLGRRPGGPSATPQGSPTGKHAPTRPPKQAHNANASASQMA